MTLNKIKAKQLEDLVITVDGHSASGKGTISTYLSREFDLKHLDSGKLFRLASCLIVFHSANKNTQIGSSILDLALALQEVSKKKIETTDPVNRQLILTIQQELLDHAGVLEDNLEYASIREALLAEEVGQLASLYSTDRNIRAMLLEVQHSLIANWKKVILDGRDAGSVVYPQAQLKFFITASSKVRAQRRFEQLKSHNKLGGLTLEELEEEINERDKRDSARQEAPLIIPQGAIEMDTSNLTRATMLERVKEEVLKQLALLL